MNESAPERALSFREVLAVSYGNLAMAHYAVSRGDQTYSRTAYMVRARLTKGLRTGKMSVGSLFADEKWKLSRPDACVYCGESGASALDHLIPKKAGGRDAGDNLVPACVSCNSSKGGKDVLVWYHGRGDFPPLLVLRRYLKIADLLVREAGLMDASVDSRELKALPIAVDAVPISRFPAPGSLRL